MYAAIRSDHYFAHLSSLLYHSPLEARRYSRDQLKISQSLWPEEAIRIAMGFYSAGSGSRSLTDGLAHAGAHLMEFASMSPTDFKLVYIDKCKTSRLESLKDFEDALRAHPTSPTYWKADIRMMIEQHKMNLKAPTRLTCDPLRARTSDEKSAELELQRSVYRYGELLHWWPQMVLIAKELKANGIQLGRRL